MTETKTDIIDLIHQLVSEGRLEEAIEIYESVKEPQDNAEVFIEYWSTVSVAQLDRASAF